MLNRRDALGGLMMMMVAAEGAGAGESGGAKSWPDAVFTREHGTTTNAPFGSVTVYFEGPTEQLKYMTAGCAVLNPGQEPHPPHRHPEEEFMLIEEGTGEILVAGKTTQVASGSLMYCDGNHEHGIKNTGTVPMRFSYFKWLK